MSIFMSSTRLFFIAFLVSFSNFIMKWVMLKMCCAIPVASNTSSEEKPMLIWWQLECIDGNHVSWYGYREGSNGWRWWRYGKCWQKRERDMKGYGKFDALWSVPLKGPDGRNDCNDGMEIGNDAIYLLGKNGICPRRRQLWSWMP